MSLPSRAYGAAQMDTAQHDGGWVSQQHLELQGAGGVSEVLGQKAPEGWDAAQQKETERHKSASRGDAAWRDQASTSTHLRRPTPRTRHLPQGRAGVPRSAGWDGVAGDTTGRLSRQTPPHSGRGSLAIGSCSPGRFCRRPGSRPASRNKMSPEWEKPLAGLPRPRCWQGWAAPWWIARQASRVTPGSGGCCPSPPG